MMDLIGAALWAIAGFLFADPTAKNGGKALAIYALVCAGAATIILA
jgi:hypothetical protein